MVIKSITLALLICLDIYMEKCFRGVLNEQYENLTAGGDTGRDVCSVPLIPLAVGQTSLYARCRFESQVASNIMGTLFL